MIDLLGCVLTAVGAFGVGFYGDWKVLAAFAVCLIGQALIRM